MLAAGKQTSVPPPSVIPYGAATTGLEEYLIFVIASWKFFTTNSISK